MTTKILSIYYGNRKESGLVKLHTHDFWQIELITYGTIQSVLVNKSHILQTGDMLLIPPGWEHEFVYEDSGTAWITFKFERDEVDDPFWGGLVRGSNFTDRLVFSLKTMIRSSVLKDYEKVFINGIIETVFQYVKTQDFNKLKHPSHVLIGQITEKIMSRNGGPITVNELAEALSYSRSHLSKKFMEITGESLKAFIDKKRMEKAEEMLRYREFSISEIAEDLGFKDIYSFSRFFKKHTGISPRDFI